MLDALGIEKAHIHGTSMGGMVAIIVAGKYPERVQSVVINCAAAKLGFAGRLVFKNWIDLIKLEGCGSRILAELIAWQCLSRALHVHARGPGRGRHDPADPARRQRGPGDDPGLRGDERDGQPRLGPKITSPALVIGGDEDVMTPWDQGPDGAGQQWIADNLPNGETYVVRGGNHSTIFDSTEDHAQAVTAFFTSTPARPRRRRGRRARPGHRSRARHLAISDGGEAGVEPAPLLARQDLLEERRDDADGLVGDLEQVGVPDVGELVDPRPVGTRSATCAALKPDGASSGGVMMSRLPFVSSSGRRISSTSGSRSIVSIARHAWRTV